MAVARFDEAGGTTASAAAATLPASAAVDRLLGVYALVSGSVLLLPGRPVGWPLLALLHAALAWFALAGPGALALRRSVARAAPRAARFLRDWYPLLLIPAFYTVLEPLNIAVHGGRMFDDFVIRTEAVLFGGQPSLEWAAAAPWLLLSEPLHAAYLAYYLILYVPALVIWLRRPRGEFRLAVFTLMLAFVAHYLFFIFLPVEGPRYRFPAPQGGIEEGTFYQLAHRILEAGSSRGAAFPSSHVGASAAVTVATFRALPRAGPVLALLTLGVALGAVYGGFHYATDAAAGLLLGAGAALAAPGVMRMLEAGRARTPARATM